ncbi:MAG: hypothetical protein ACYT04_42555 [Nostoc sp.]
MIPKLVNLCDRSDANFAMATLERRAIIATRGLFAYTTYQTYPLRIYHDTRTN